MQNQEGWSKVYDDMKVLIVCVRSSVVKVDCTGCSRAFSTMKQFCSFPSKLSSVIAQQVSFCSALSSRILE